MTPQAGAETPGGAIASPSLDARRALDRILDHQSALTPMHSKIRWLSAMGVFLDS